MRVAGEVGLKEPCPCGSGRKYKNCCRRQGFKFVKGAEGQVEKKDPQPIVRPVEQPRRVVVRPPKS